MYSSNQNKMCINCKKKGHFYKECRFPLNSYGILLFRVTDLLRIEYLFVCRKHTFGYVELLRGGYQDGDYDNLRQFLTEITFEERENLTTRDFRWLWEDLWMFTLEDDHEKNMKDFNTAKKKFECMINDEQYKKLLTEVPCLWDCPEWGFPKGRKNWGEEERVCAMRECQEETNIDPSSYQMLDDLSPIVENFTGTDNKSYRNTYYVCYCYNNKMSIGINKDNLGQQREISKITWFDLEGAKQNIRPYNFEKINLLIRLEKRIRANLNRYVNMSVQLQSDLTTTTATPPLTQGAAISPPPGLEEITLKMVEELEVDDLF